jgi:glutamyl-tRNA reductase
MISQGAVSVASAAVQIAGRIFGDLRDRRVLLVGAGETARLAAKHLATAGVGMWRVCNRTEANAKAVADLLGGRVTSFPPTVEDLAWADLVVSATGSPEPVITTDMVKAGKKKRRGTQLILDLAVPRDVEPGAGKLRNQFLFTVDDFEELVATNLAARKREAERTETIVREFVSEFTDWYRQNRVAPTIEQLKDVLEELRRREVEENLRRFHETDREQVEQFSRSLMRKVTSLVVANLKRASLEEDDLEMAKAVTLALADEQQSGKVDDVLEKLDHELSH